jgi:hypothetical protein
VLTRVALVWSKINSGCETKPTALGPALGISRLESSVGWATARRPPLLPARRRDIASRMSREPCGVSLSSGASEPSQVQRPDSSRALSAGPGHTSGYSLDTQVSGRATSLEGIRGRLGRWQAAAGQAVAVLLIHRGDSSI